MSVMAPAREWTAEQLEAIERRDGDLLLAAAAGSGKTSVLVERFVRMVLEDEVDVSAILTITFTEKAAAEMRDRIRERLRELGEDEAARQTEGAFISTIHGFCARLLRAHAVAVGIDPAFTVLDQPDAQRLADAAFDDALEHVPGAVDLIAAYGAGPIRAAILAVHDELRSRGQSRPELPPLPDPPDLETARAALELAAAAVARELGAIDKPSTKVVQALDRLERLGTAIDSETDPWPGALDRFSLPGGNGAALTTDACAAYAEALAAFRRAVEHRYAIRTHAVLARLLAVFAEGYAARKRASAGLDFEDLELLTRDVLAADDELRERYRSRFAQVMVDEFQDTNHVQLALIESIADGNLFTVGDAQQSIYGFRHADVELFERRAKELARIDSRLGLTINFRSRPEILAVINAAFDFPSIGAGRSDPPADDPRVELIVADKAAAWAVEGQASPWRLAEARALAGRVIELVETGTPPGDVVVLTRATTDLRTYERALEERGVPTYVIGGRGYWTHPQVIDLLAYLRALANPLDEEALVMLLASPLVAATPDELVLLAGAARAEKRALWEVVKERRAAFAEWFEAEREAARQYGVDELIDRALARTGYDLAVLAMPGGRRRLANVRKLMRLAREQPGIDVRGFLDLVERRASEWSVHESEAPVEGETVDAVRLMTIHRAKGLEFDVVCVADLGRGPRWPAELMRLGRDGRFGLRLSEPGTSRAVPALDYLPLGEARAEAEAAEERRLFYVAMTRARERLILSGAARLDAWPESGSPIAWIGPAVVPDIAERVDEGDGVTDAGVQFAFVGADGETGAQARAPFRFTAPAPVPGTLTEHEPEPPTAPTVTTLSYSSLEEYDRCGYRFYAERVLGLPGRRPQAGGGPSGIERGVRVHELLERLDFRRPVIPEADADTQALIERFAQSELCRRLGRAMSVRREQRFRFLLGDVLVQGALDVLAREPGQLLVVDYKTGTSTRSYALQQLIYGLAVLRSGAPQVEVVHVFLERPEETTRGHLHPGAETGAGAAARTAGRRGEPSRVPGHRHAASRRVRRVPGRGRAVLVAARDDAPRSARSAVLSRVKLDVDLLALVALLDLGQRAQGLLVGGRLGRAEQAARVQLPRHHHVDLGRVQGQLCAEVQPHEQRDHERELRVRAAGVAVDVVDVKAAGDLQPLPERGSGDDADPQAAGPDAGRGHESERGQEEAEVDQQRDHDPTDLHPRPAQSRDQARDHRRDDEQKSQTREQEQSPQPGLDEVRPILERHRPHGVERVLSRLGDAQAAQQRGHEPDRQRRRVAAQLMYLDLLADDRELAEDRVLDLVSQPRVALEHEAEDRGQDEQERKQREEGVVGDQRGQIARVVVAELAQHGHRDGQRLVLLLEGVEDPDRSQDVHAPVLPA